MEGEEDYGDLDLLVSGARTTRAENFDSDLERNIGEEVEEEEQRLMAAVGAAAAVAGGADIHADIPPAGTGSVAEEAGIS